MENKQVSNKFSNNSQKKVVVVGGGPGGLFCALKLLEKGFSVDLYEGTSGVGKKFLVAGHGGLNLTHSEDISKFVTRYGSESTYFLELLKDFSPNDLRDFCRELGVDTFVGSSGRVFPTKFKAAEMLIFWTKKLKSFDNFNLYTKHKLVNIKEDKSLVFKIDNSEELIVKNDLVVFSLGGGSWKKTGSDGEWTNFFESLGINILPFQSANSGFETNWTETFLEKVDNDPVKNVRLKIGDRSVKGEIMLTPYGVEGGAFYAISREIREEINRSSKAEVLIDLKPDLELEKVLEKLKRPKGKNSLSNHLRKTLKISKTSFILLKELTSKEDFDDLETLARKIKALPLELSRTRPLDESISTAGGVSFNELDNGLMLKKIPGFFVIGEMIDWEAPTGGYLLQGCFSTAYRAANSISSLKLN